MVRAARHRRLDLDAGVDDSLGCLPEVQGSRVVHSVDIDALARQSGRERVDERLSRRADARCLERAAGEHHLDVLARRIGRSREVGGGGREPGGLRYQHCRNGGGGCGHPEKPVVALHGRTFQREPFVGWHKTPVKRRDRTSRLAPTNAER